MEERVGEVRQKIPQSANALRSELGEPVVTVDSLLRARERLCGASPALWYESQDSSWTAKSWTTVLAESEQIAARLVELGLLPGDRVAILASTCVEWDLMHLGVLAAGAVVVGMDPGDLAANLRLIAKTSSVSALVINDDEVLEKLGNEICSKQKFIISFKSTTESATTLSYSDIFSADETSEASLPIVQPDDLATIIFTSGTTGEPKGIAYSHRQICLAIEGIREAFPDINAQSCLLCWLPLSNLFQRIVNVLAIASGAQVYYCEQPKKIMHYIATLNPHLFVGVPRFYEKLYEGIAESVEKMGPFKKRLVQWALMQGDRYAEAGRSGLTPGLALMMKYKLADLLVLNKLRATMGQSLRYMVSGSAPMPLWLLERFHAMGLLILEAYGMSENILPVAMNTLREYRFGSVGKPLAGCELQISEDGELLVRGPCVTSNYLGEPGVNLLDESGYYASGDLATIDADGFVTLTGRKSEIIKTATGRRIAPVAIESIMQQLEDVEQVMVYGQGKPFLIALLTLTDRASRDGAEREQVCRSICNLLSERLQALPSYTRPVGVVITTRQFRVEDGELTANLKLRRKCISERYALPIELLYEKLNEKKDAEIVQIHESTNEVILCSL